MLATVVNLGKILVNDDGFAKFAKVFPHQNFCYTVLTDVATYLLSEMSVQSAHDENSNSC